MADEPLSTPSESEPSNDDTQVVGPPLDPDEEEVLNHIAQTNRIEKEWPILRNIIKRKLAMNLAIPDQSANGTPVSGETVEDYRERIIEILDGFNAPPFTIQRLCELLINPTQHHKTQLKYMRAMEKVVMVTLSFEESPQSIPNPMVNGTTGNPEPSLATEAFNITTAAGLQPITFHHYQTPAQEEHSNLEAQKTETEDQPMDMDTTEEETTTIPSSSSSSSSVSLTSEGEDRGQVNGGTVGDETNTEVSEPVAERSDGKNVIESKNEGGLDETMADA